MALRPRAARKSIEADGLASFSTCDASLSPLVKYDGLARCSWQRCQDLVHLVTVSQVRVVMLLPNVFSSKVMNTGPFGPGT